MPVMSASVGARARTGMLFDHRVTSDLVDLPALRAVLVAHAVRGLDDVEVLADGSTRHRRLVAVGGGHARLTVTVPPRTIGIPVVRAEGSPDAVAAATAVGRRWVGLDADPAPGVAALADDPVLGPLVSARPHLRVPGSTDPFDLVGLQAFPSPDALAVVEPGDLQRAVGITTARARTVVAIARSVADGTLDLTGAPDVAQVRARLLALPGVGPWTADLVALRAWRDPDVFLPGDLVLRQALGGVTAREAATASDAWRPHRSLAVLHLWTHHAIDPR